MQINRYLMPLTTIVALLGTIFVARIAGYWQTSGRQMVDPTKPLTDADIRGWMPLEYLAENMDLSHEELCALLGLPTGTPPQTLLKDLEDTIEVSEAREIVAGYLGKTPPAHEQGEPASEVQDPIPPTPIAVTPAPTPTTAASEHQPGSGPGTGDGSGAAATPLPPGQIHPAAEIRGRMTLREVSDQCSVPLQVLYEALALPDDLPPDTVLRDVQAQVQGFEVSTVRDVVAAHQAR